MKCSACRRQIKYPVYIDGVAFGSTCARAITGIKARRSRKVIVDERTADLFANQPN